MMWFSILIIINFHKSTVFHNDQLWNEMDIYLIRYEITNARKYILFSGMYFMKLYDTCDFRHVWSSNPNSNISMKSMLFLKVAIINTSFLWCEIDWLWYIYSVIMFDIDFIWKLFTIEWNHSLCVHLTFILLRQHSKSNGKISIAIFGSITFLEWIKCVVQSSIEDIETHLLKSIQLQIIQYVWLQIQMNNNDIIYILEWYIIIDSRVFAFYNKIRSMLSQEFIVMKRIIAFYWRCIQIIHLFNNGIMFNIHIFCVISFKKLLLICCHHWR
jgi:hypothetical protein